MNGGLALAAYFASRDEPIVIVLILLIGVIAAVVWSRSDAKREQERALSRMDHHRRCTSQHRHVRLIAPEHTKETYDHIG